MSVAKNYLSEQEMRSLERIVSAYLDLAEDHASIDASSLINFYSQYGHPISRESHQFHSFFRRIILFDNLL